MNNNDYVYVITAPIDEESDGADCVFANFDDADAYLKDMGFNLKYSGKENNRNHWYYKNEGIYDSNTTYRCIDKVRVYTQRVELAKWKVDIFDKLDGEHLDTDYVIANADYSWDDIINDGLYVIPYKTNVEPTRIG